MLRAPNSGRAQPLRFAPVIISATASPAKCSLALSFGRRRYRYAHNGCSASSASPCPSFLRAPNAFKRPHRSVGFVVAAAPFRRHCGRCLYRLPPLLIVLKAPPLAVLRSPRRVLRPRFAPVRGWSRGSAPTRARRPVSHSARPLFALLSGGALPPLNAESGRGLPTVAPLFCRLPLCFAVSASGGFPAVQLPAVCPPAAPPDCPPLVVLFCRLPPCATRPIFCVVGLRPPMLNAPPPRGGLSAPLPLPPSVFHGYGLPPKIKKP